MVATVIEEWLDAISNVSTIICASGMRVQTMMQREKYFGSIKYWMKRAKDFPAQ
jgi:hypothetical protein